MAFFFFLFSFGKIIWVGVAANPVSLFLSIEKYLQLKEKETRIISLHR